MPDPDANCSEETRLAQRAVRDKQAFLTLYDRYFARIYTYFRYRCDDPATCDDLTSQTFTQALDKIEQYRAERGPFAAWLFGIARNLNSGRFRQAERCTELSLDELDCQEEGLPSVEEIVIGGWEQTALVAAIASLSAQHKDLLGLKFSGRLTNRQIAGLTGLSEQNVAVLLYRAIRLLRKKLAAMEKQID
jgi:RNA polymerase sigma-70 factor, ECF subfamily